MTKEQQKAIYDTLMRHLDDQPPIKRFTSYGSGSGWYEFKIDNSTITVDNSIVKIGINQLKLSFWQGIKLRMKVGSVYKKQQEKSDQKFADQVLKEIQSALKME